MLLLLLGAVVVVAAAVLMIVVVVLNAVLSLRIDSHHSLTMTRLRNRHVALLSFRLWLQQIPCRRRILPSVAIIYGAA